jgi:arylsulfatase A-like enzyme
MSISRRNFFLSGLALPAFAAKRAPDRPNVLLIVADDLPAWALGCYGNKEIHTPNIDRLATIGTRFADNFTAAPAAGLGRATLLTGRTPMQLQGASDLPASEITIGKFLAGQGYSAQTASDAAAANAFLDAQTVGKPFSLTVHLAMPGEAASEKHLASYSAAKFDTLAPDTSSTVPNPVASLRKAAAAITTLDEQVQSVISRLIQKNLRDPTLVIFTSSCGAMLSRHGLWGAGDASTPPNFYDESLRTPMLWSWPGKVPTNGVRPELTSSYDVLPTIVELLSIAPPAGNSCGRSYALLATGKMLPKKQPWRTTVFAELKGSGAARVQRYKLVEHPSAPAELYNLTADPGERINQFQNQQFADIRTSLGNELHQWKQRYSAS